MKEMIISHKNCLDGAGSVAAYLIATDKDYNDVYVQWWQYGYSKEKFEDLLTTAKDRDVIVMDFSFKPDEVRELKEVVKSIKVVDHHESAMKDLLHSEHKDVVVFDNNESGATLVWKTFSSEEYVPYVLQLIKDRDLWEWDIEETEAFTTGLYSLYTVGDNIVDIITYLIELELGGGNLMLDEVFNTIIDMGEHELKKKDIEVEKKTNSDEFVEFEVTIGEYTYLIPMVNSDRHQSEIGNALAKKSTHNIAGVYYINNYGVVIISLRSIESNSKKSLTANQVAKMFDGNGHKHASGMKLTLKYFVDRCI